MSGASDDNSDLGGSELNPNLRRYLWSLLIALVLFTLIAVLGSFNSPVGALLWPGYMVSGIFFATGIHSDSPNGFLVVAGCADVVIYSGVAFGVLSWTRYFRSRGATQVRR